MSFLNRPLPVTTRLLPVVAVLGTLDTKGEEFAYVCGLIRAHGCLPLIIDTGVLGTPRHIQPDITREDVARAAGSDLAVVATLGRGPAVDVMAEGVAQIVSALHAAGAISGILSMGGAEGTVLGCHAMQALPIGFPKVMVSAIASGNRTFGDFVGFTDIHISNSVVDVAGFNDVSKAIYRNAAASVCGMAAAALADDDIAGDDEAKLPAIGVSMLGNTQKAFDCLVVRLADRFDLLPFHANGSGGPTMERLAADGFLDAIIELTPSEVSNELRDGVMASQTDTRLQVAGPLGIPQIVIPGCVDFFQAGPIDELRPEWAARPTYVHNPHFTLVKATEDEMVTAGKEFARRLNMSTGSLTVVWPNGGLSLADAPGGEFWDPQADAAFLAALRQGLDVPYDFVEVDAHINAGETADVIVATLEKVLSE